MAYPNSPAIAGRRAVGAQQRSGGRSERAGIDSNPAVRGAEPTGNHTEGVTVADLIAKVAGTGAHGLSTTPAEPAPRPTEPEPAPDCPDDRQTDPDTEIIPVASAYASELPDLAALGRRTRAGYRPRASAPRWQPAARTAPRPPQGHARRPCRRGADRRAGAGADRRCVAVAIGEEQHAQQGLGAGPGLARHRRPERTVRRRELPHRRGGQPVRREQRHGRGRHRGRRGRPLGHRDAGQHPRQPRTRGRRVVSARPRRSRRSSARRGIPQTGEYGPVWDEETQSYGPEEVLHRDQAELRLFLRRAEMPGEGDSEDVGPVRQPVHGGRLRRLLQDGRRARRCRGVQHHPAGGLRAGHRAAHRRPADRSTGTPR